MTTTATNLNVAHPFCSVKPEINTQFPLFPDTMIHHNNLGEKKRIIVSNSVLRRDGPYGVSPSRRVLSPGLFLKRHDNIRQFLKGVLGLTPRKAEAILRLLRLWAYYGNVYPKAVRVAYDPSRITAACYGIIADHPLSATGEPGCSKATFWRAIRELESRGLILVVNRYVIRPHAQISNLYRLDRLILVIARYLAEHGVAFREKWLKPYLFMPGSQFWSWTRQPLGSDTGPIFYPYSPTP